MEQKTIREWRVVRGKTQQQLANEAGISISALTGAETFRKIPNIRNAQKIARALQVTLNDIKWLPGD